MVNSGRLDYWLLFAVLTLLTIGVVMVYSASGFMAQTKYNDQLLFFKKQLVWLLVALPFFILATKLNYQIYRKLALPALVFGFILLGVVLFLPATKGVHRWIRLGPLGIQASEVFKYALILFLADSLSRKLEKIRKFKHLLFPYLVILVLLLALILLEPDLGSAMLISSIFLTILFVAKARLLHLASFLLPGLAGFSLLVFGLGYEKDRIVDYLNGLENPLKGSYHLSQSVISLGNGGFHGVGLGEGRQKFLFLPEPHTDFIFATIGEEGGFVWLAAILLLFMVIAWRGIAIAAKAPDYFGFLLASGISLAIFSSALLNIGVVTGMLPTTGIPLPFLSYGGSSLFLSFAAAGIVLNISKAKKSDWE
ncbi:MAG: cell division protein FtsW [candidate division Zixibacteria bacterium RBG_16_48_11]|nr:MAG: cell division protein FtsW [candidate division Zixibacteria bacterium RBG_16_48_11]